jgi:putative acetyltransferase
MQTQPTVALQCPCGRVAATSVTKASTYYDAVSDPAAVRIMRADEFDVVRTVSIASFDEPAIGDLLDALHDSWAWRDDLSFVAELEGRVVGHVLYTHAIVDSPTRLEDVLVLSPVGILPELQRMGLGTRLITETLAALDARGASAVFLEGHPSYYPRFGFQPAGALGFIKPSLRIPDAAFMVKRLSAFDPSLTGTLVYPDAFWRTDSVGLR